MATVPTGKMERELRSYYLRWLANVGHTLDSMSSDALNQAMAEFEAGYRQIVEKWGGQAARQGFRAGFPAPKPLPLSVTPGFILSKMQEAAISASIASGLNARTIARGMLRAGMDKEFYKLERLARTEVVRAYWGNARAQAKELGMVLVWSSEDGPRTCDSCRAKDGLVVNDPTVFDHPNGRCTLIPTLPQLLDDKVRELPPEPHTELEPDPVRLQVDLEVVL